MSARSRVYATVVVIAVVAAGAVVGISAQSSDRPPSEARASTPVARAGAPPLSLDLGVRSDDEAIALRRAEMLYNSGSRRRAARIFRSSTSLEARVGTAYAGWPDGTVDRLQQLAALHARSALVQLHLGIALYWAGLGGAADAWAAAAANEPDTTYAIKASDLLHPGFPVPGLPQFIPSFDPPTAITALPPADQLRALARAARNGGVREKLLYGIGLQRVGRPVSAERAFADAVTIAPNDPEALVARAVGMFDKADPSRAFSHLGPLTTRFPHQSTVRFHLGLLLLWSGDGKGARRQLRLAESAQPGSLLARAAATYLQKLG